MQSSCMKTNHNFIAAVQALMGFVLFISFEWFCVVQALIGLHCKFSPALCCKLPWLLYCSLPSTLMLQVCNWLVCTKPHNGSCWQAFLGFFLKLSMALCCKPSNGCLLQEFEKCVGVCAIHFGVSHVSLYLLGWPTLGQQRI